MSARIMDPIGRLMGLRYKSHPWHGIDIGKESPEVLTCFIEMVPTDTVKYEVDKVSGYLKIDRPQKYSNLVPALYGFIPQTFSGKEVAEFSCEKTGDMGIKGDGDPIDICILTEKEITHTYGIDEAHEVIRRSIKDYQTRFESLDDALSSV